ncbi:ATPase [Henriciella sp.]|uniref:F0F1 ATP synthase subunit B family protein n=1 Tax=Henriciella sp. TaxID=1968823 RepID=UPI002635BBFA|nr:ATPase [Henriciella sp.]
MSRFFSTFVLSAAMPLAALAQGSDDHTPADTAGHEGSTGFHHILEPFTDPTTNVAFSALVVFLIIAGALGAFKFVGRSLDERAEGIQKQLDESRALREEAAAMLAEAERKQKEADQTAEAMIKQAKADAKLMVEQARKDLADKVARREAQAEARIARAEAEAAEDVRRAAADAATRASKDILAGSSKRSELFTEALDEIEKALN